MRSVLQLVASIAHLGAALLLSTSATAEVATAPIAPEALRADLRLVEETIERLHPDLAHSVNPARLKQAIAELERQLGHPMNQEEAWATLAQLNPVFADGHVLIGLPDWRSESASALQHGASFFPFEVSVDAAGRVVIVSALGGAATPLAGARIMQIDGRAGKVAGALLARAHGDTAASRAALVSQRWWLFHSKLYGMPAAYDLVLEGTPDREVHVDASHVLPEVLAREASFERLFGCELRPDGGAVLTVGSFNWPDKPRFFKFTGDCFARIKASGARRLVIDVRQNGGGDDDLWKDGILRYIANRPYRHGSWYVKRDTAGQRVRGVIESWTEPVPIEPLRFDGEVIVLVGSLTYSSAVLFANVVQDFGFGSVAGTGGTVRSRQSGGVQSIRLPNSGLTLSYPRFVLRRPSDEKGAALVDPDFPLVDDPLCPAAAIDHLLRPHRGAPADAATSAARPIP